MLHLTRTLVISILVSLFIMSCGGGGDDGGGSTPTGPTMIQMGGARQGVPLNLTTAVTTLAGSPGVGGSNDGTGSAARFAFPQGVATDGVNLYVMDSGNTIRRVVVATGAVTTLAGGTDGPADGTGTAAQFNSADDVTTDGTNLYVADTTNHAIRRIVIATGVVTTLAGTAGSLGSANGTGPDARFNSPEGITTDGTYLFVSDTYNHTIRRIVIATGVVTTFAGTVGVSGSANGVGNLAQFNLPTNITTDGTSLYVADTANQTIRRIVIATGEVTTIAGTAGAVGSANATGSAARFSYPEGITTDGTNLYVADTGNHTIRRIVIATGEVTTLGGTAATFGSANGTGAAARFYYPEGITTDGQRLFITDTQNHTLRAMQ